jgi:hypothetical protein
VLRSSRPGGHRGEGRVRASIGIAWRTTCRTSVRGCATNLEDAQVIRLWIEGRIAVGVAEILLKRHSIYLDSLDLGTMSSQLSSVELTADMWDALLRLKMHLCYQILSSFDVRWSRWCNGLWCPWGLLERGLWQVCGSISITFNVSR